MIRDSFRILRNIVNSVALIPLLISVHIFYLLEGWVLPIFNNQEQPQEVSVVIKEAVEKIDFSKLVSTSLSSVEIPGSPKFKVVETMTVFSNTISTTIAGISVGISPTSIVIHLPSDQA